MYKAFFSVLVTVLLFSGCNHNAELESAKLDTRSSEAYSIHQESIDDEISSLLSDVESSYKTLFTQAIENKLNVSGTTISDKAKELLVNSMLYHFNSDAIKAIRNLIGKELTSQYTSLHEELGLTDDNTSQTLEDSDKTQIETMVSDHFDTQISQGDLESILEPIANQLISKMLDSSLTLDSGLLGAEATQNDLFSNAEATSEFDTLMKSLYDDYDGSETGNNHGGALDGGTLYGDDRVTNLFDVAYVESQYYFTLTINEPYYDNGRTTCKFTKKLII